MTDAELSVVALSLRVALASIALSLLPGIAVAWLLARWQSPWAAVLRGVVMLPLVLPPVVTGYLLLLLFGRSAALGSAYQALTGTPLAYTTAACVVAAAVVGFPLLVEAIRLAIDGVDPRMEQVSRSLGRGRLATFVRITLPLAGRGVLGGVVLAFARALGEFGATIVLAGDIAGETRTVPVAVYVLLNAPGGEAAALRLVACSVGIALLALLVAGWLAGRQRRRLS